MQQAFDVGAMRALKGGISSAMSSAAREQTRLAAGFSVSVPVKRLHQVALRFLAGSRAFRGITPTFSQAIVGTRDAFNVWSHDLRAPLGAVSTELSGAGRGAVAVQDRSGHKTGERTSASRGVYTGRVEQQAAATSPTAARRAFVDRRVTPERIVRSFVPTGLAEPARTAQSLSPPRAAVREPVAVDVSNGMVGRVPAANSARIGPPTGARLASDAWISTIGVSSGADGEPETLAFARPTYSDHRSASGRAAFYATARTLPVAPVAGRARVGGAHAGADVDAAGVVARARGGRLERRVGEDVNLRSDPLRRSDETSATGGGSVGGDVFLDGALLGRWVSRLLTRDAERASVGRTGFDIRRGRLLPGPTVGGV